MSAYVPLHKVVFALVVVIACGALLTRGTCSEKAVGAEKTQNGRG